jgi:hypothetical protein
MVSHTPNGINIGSGASLRTRVLASVPLAFREWSEFIRLHSDQALKQDLHLAILAQCPIIHPTAFFRAVSLIFPSRTTPAAQQGSTLALPGTEEPQAPHIQAVAQTPVRPFSSFARFASQPQAIRWYRQDCDPARHAPKQLS